MDTMIEIGKRLKEASKIVSLSSADVRHKALTAIAGALAENAAQIIAANDADIANAKANGMTESMTDRLRLTNARIEGIAKSVLEVAAQRDIIGEVIGGSTRPNGLRIIKRRVPMGVVGMIFESRPNVTVDAAVLCLKTANVCLLRGGKEAIHSNTALANVMRKAISQAGLPEDSVILVTDTSRESAVEMMKLNGYLDLLIPRGGAGLISAVVKNATVPVIETGVGNCHVYVDEHADLEMAADILVNAKCSRPSVCNACETLLAHRAIAKEFLPVVYELLKAYNVELRGCRETKEILPDIKDATEADYAAEFLDYTLAVKVVGGVDEAMEHIARYGTRHSEAIVTQDYANALKFTDGVDAAAVYVNASTRFTDGGEFGFGAEIGISTQKLHARGPMGIEALTSYKYIVMANGQVR